MKKLFSILLITVVLLSGCAKKNTDNTQSSPSPERTQNEILNEKLKINVSGDEPLMFSKNGKPEGFGIEFSSLLASELGVQAEYVNDGTADVTLKLSDKAEQNVVGTIIKNDCLIITPANKRIDEKADLGGKFIGISADGYTLDCIKKDKLYGELVDGLMEYNDLSAAFRDIDSGRLNALIIDKVTALYRLKNRELDYEVADEVFEGKEYSFAAQNEALGKKIKSALPVVVKSEGAAKISDKWFGENIIENRK